MNSVHGSQYWTKLQLRLLRPPDLYRISLRIFELGKVADTTQTPFAPMEKHPHQAIDEGELAEIERRLMRYKPTVKLEDVTAQSRSTSEGAPLYRIVVGRSNICHGSYVSWGFDHLALVPIPCPGEARRKATMLHYTHY